MNTATSTECHRQLAANLTPCRSIEAALRANYSACICTQNVGGVRSLLCPVPAAPLTPRTRTRKISVTQRPASSCSTRRASRSATRFAGSSVSRARRPVCAAASVGPPAPLACVQNDGLVLLSLGVPAGAANDTLVQAASSLLAYGSVAHRVMSGIGCGKHCSMV